MSYGMAVALQSAVFVALTANQQVMTLSGGAIHDALPSGPVAPLLVSRQVALVRVRAAPGFGSATR